MAKLQFSLEGNALGEYELTKERMTIGRRSGNDIHIDNLAVSGEHAVITTIGGDSFLEDMNSTNGTLVNGKTVKKHVLHHMDAIEFGKYLLLYVNAAQSKIPANHSGFENTVVVTRPAKLSIVAAQATEKPEPEADIAEQVVTPQAIETPAELITETATAERLAPTATAENSPKVGRLQMLSGVNSGREITLNKALTTLGKAGAQVSVITKRPHGYFLTHVEGENLPFINGQQIGSQAQPLNDHDVIDLAGIKMEFFLA